jgi:hypothetical protein
LPSQRKKTSSNLEKLEIIQNRLKEFSRNGMNIKMDISSKDTIIKITISSSMDRL